MTKIRLIFIQLIILPMFYIFLLIYGKLLLDYNTIFLKNCIMRAFFFVSQYTIQALYFINSFLGLSYYWYCLLNMDYALLLPNSTSISAVCLPEPLHYVQLLNGKMIWNIMTWMKLTVFSIFMPSNMVYTGYYFS